LIATVEEDGRTAVAKEREGVVAPPTIPTGSFFCQRILPVLTSTAVNVPVPASGYFFVHAPPRSMTAPSSIPFEYGNGFFGTVVFCGTLMPDR